MGTVDLRDGDSSPTLEVVEQDVNYERPGGPSVFDHTSRPFPHCSSCGDVLHDLVVGSHQVRPRTRARFGRVFHSLGRRCR